MTICKVSVIIPYYNRKEKIFRALGSVINQTYTDFEIILINDGSTDNGDKLVDDFIEKNKEIRIIHLHQKNGGPSKARNRGIIASQGEYIAFLDSDDSWERNKLENQINFMEKNKDIMITGTNYKIKTDSKIITKYNSTEKYVRANFYKMLFKMFFCMPTVIVKSKIFKDDNLFFREGKNFAEDHLIFLQIVRRYKGVRIGVPLTNIYKYEYGQDGLTKNLNYLKQHEYDNFRILYSENKCNTKKINFLTYILVFIFAYGKHLKRVCMSKVHRKIKFQKY